MYYDFVSNVITVLFFCGVVIWVDLSLNKKYSCYMLGVLFGFMIIFIIKTDMMVVEGLCFDFRHITITMAGFIGGPVTAVIAVFMSSLYRYIVDGSGALGGIANIIIFASFGIILGRHLKNKEKSKQPLQWFLIGIVMTCILLFIMKFIAPLLNNRVPVIGTVSGLFLITTPFVMTIIFKFYFWANNFFSKALILETIINKSSINLMIFDAHGPILSSNALTTELQSGPYIEKKALLLSLDKSWLNMEKQYREIATEDERYFATDYTSFQMPSGEYACVAILNDVTDRKREQEKLREAKETFFKAFNLGPHMMALIKKSDYRYIDVNRRFLEAGGFKYEDVIGKTPIEIGVSESKFKKVIKILETEGSVQNFEDSIVSKLGTDSSVIFSAQKIQLDDQECFLFAYNDVTEMKRLQTERIEQLTKHLNIEADLSRSNQHIADIINNMPDVFYALDNQWRFTFVNNKAEDLLLKTREELLGEVLWKIIPGMRGTLLELNYQKACKDCSSMTFEFLSSSQRDTWYQVTAYPSHLGLSVYYRDITERKLAGDILLNSQKEKAFILESMTDCFCALDRDWQYTYINRAAEIAFGKSRDELLGKKATGVFGINDSALLPIHNAINEMKSVTFETHSEALGNKWLEVSVYPGITGFTCYFRDITSRKIAQETLRQSEEKFSKAFHGGPIMMTLATVKEGRFIDANNALCSSIGYTRKEIIGHTSKELNLFVDMNERQGRGKMLMEQGRIENAEVDFRTKSGEIRHGLSWSQLFYLDGQPCHITGLIDVTEQKRIQNEMAKLDRLNLIGQMAASIAHEVRNPMTVVRGYLQLLGAKPGYAAQKSTFDLMILELDRANLIITEFLSLAQTKKIELKSQNLNDVLNNLFPILEADTFTQNKQINFILGEIPNLKLNGKEVSQLVLNLVRNGLEAMQERGRLTVKSYLQDGKVVLAVADEGCGILPENISKVGTPFFTTKDNGTGLGLATCYKIAESHNAKVHIDSGPSGTTFLILFPIPNQKLEHMTTI